MKPGTLARPTVKRAQLSGSAPGVSAPQPPSAGSVQSRDKPNILAFEQGQRLLKQRLNRSLQDTFCELTGLHLHARWHPCTADDHRGSVLGMCSQVRPRLAGRLQAQCEACAKNQWQPAPDGCKNEKRFAGLCGSANFCAWVDLLERPCVTLSVQQPAPASLTRKQAFLRAVHLMRLVIHDLEATLQAGQRLSSGPLSQNSGQTFGPTPQPATSWGCPGEALVSSSLLQSTTAGYARVARRPNRAARSLPPVSTHSWQLTQRMLDYIHANYAHPIQLADLAACVRLRPTYVSSLFSATAGVTFHHYLEEFRLAKAKELLRDPTNRVSEVAYAVGYSNSNHFRNVFTARAGFSPSAWRATAPSPDSAS
jgi:AraC-like DNA-binding protein